MYRLPDYPQYDTYQSANPVIDTQNVHPLINQIVQQTSALRGTTVLLSWTIIIQKNMGLLENMQFNVIV